MNVKKQTSKGTVILDDGRELTFAEYKRELANPKNDKIDLKFESYSESKRERGNRGQRN